MSVFDFSLSWFLWVSLVASALHQWKADNHDKRPANSNWDAHNFWSPVSIVIGDKSINCVPILTVWCYFNG